MMRYFLPGFCEIYQGISDYRANMISFYEISKGYNFIKIVAGVTVLFLCILSDDALYLCHVS